MLCVTFVSPKKGFCMTRFLAKALPCIDILRLLHPPDRILFLFQLFSFQGLRCGAASSGCFQRDARKPGHRQLGGGSNLWAPRCILRQERELCKVREGIKAGHGLLDCLLCNQSFSGECLGLLQSPAYSYDQFMDILDSYCYVAWFLLNMLLDGIGGRSAAVRCGIIDPEEPPY